MFTFIIRRLLIAIPTVFLASVLVFVLVVNSGDPLEELRQRPNSATAIVSRTQQLNLDKSIPERYWIWFSNFVQGDFGKDLTNQEVRPKLQNALTLTLRLVVISLLVAIVLGVSVGVLSAVRQYTAFDYGATFLAFLFFAMPVFWFAVLLKEFGAIKLNNVLEGWGFSRWISTVGPSSPNFEGSFWARIGDYAGHMILPIITLTVISFATYSRFQRASMLDTLSSDYVRTARAKGLSNRRVIFRHAFRTALIPVVTLVALDFGAVLGGAIITENIFSWQGMGSLLRNGILRGPDVNVVMAYLMVTAIIVVIFNLIADIAYAYLDPRIRID